MREGDKSGEKRLEGQDAIKLVDQSITSSIKHAMLPKVFWKSFRSKMLLPSEYFAWLHPLFGRAFTLSRNLYNGPNQSGRPPAGAYGVDRYAACNRVQLAIMNNPPRSSHKDSKAKQKKFPSIIWILVIWNGSRKWILRRKNNV